MPCGAQREQRVLRKAEVRKEATTFTSIRHSLSQPSVAEISVVHGRSEAIHCARFRTRQTWLAFVLLR